MYPETTQVLQTSLKLAEESREENGLSNPGNVSVSAYWQRTPQTTQVKQEGVIGYNIHMILKDGAQMLEEQKMRKRAVSALKNEESRDQVAATIVRKWNQMARDDSAKAVSVSAIFHGLEVLHMRENVSVEEDSFFDSFAGEAIGSFVRDQLFRGMDPVTSRTIIAKKFPNHHGTYIGRNNSLVEPEVYEKCYRFLEVLEEMTPQEIHESYQEIDSLEELIE